MNQFDETLETKEYTALSESEWEVLRSELEGVSSGSMADKLSFLKSRGYRIAFNTKYPQYLRSVPVKSGGGEIVRVGSDHFEFRLPGKATLAVPYGIILLLL